MRARLWTVFQLGWLNHTANLAATLSLLGCLSLGQQSQVRDVDAEDLLQDSLGSHEIRGCEQDEALNWPLASSVRNLRIVSPEEENVLIYEAVHRDKVKTVWQSLDNSFAFREDGIYVGDPRHHTIIDFQITQLNGNTWSTYRHKAKNQEKYVAVLEFVSKKGTPLKRFTPAIPSGASAQQIWIFGSHKNANHVSVIVKSYRTRGIDSRGATYSWYFIDPIKDRIQLRGQFVDRLSAYDNVNFVMADANSEPLAIALVQETQLSSMPSATEKTSQRLVAERTFHESRSQVTLFATDSSLLSSLQTHLSPVGTTLALNVAWIGEDTINGKTYLQWLSLPVAHKNEVESFAQRLTDPKLAAPLRKRTLKSFLALNHFPTELHFRDLTHPPMSKARDLRLAWLAGLDDDVAYLTTPVYRSSKKQTQQPATVHLVDSTEIRSAGLGEITGPNGSTVLLYMNRQKRESMSSVQKNGSDANIQRPQHIRACVFNLKNRS